MKFRRFSAAFMTADKVYGRKEKFMKVKFVQRLLASVSAAAMSLTCMVLPLGENFSQQIDVRAMGDDVWKQLYAEELRTFMQSDSYSDPNKDTMGAMFDLYDADNNGIPELFISWSGAHFVDVEVYIYNDGKLTASTVASAFGVVECNSEHAWIKCETGSTGAMLGDFYEVNGDSVDEFLLYSYVQEGMNDYNEPPRLNNKECSYEEIYAVIEEYNAYSWDTVGRQYAIDEATISTVLATSATSATSSTPETPNIVVLGDDMGAGTDLPEGAQSYAEQIGSYLNANVTNFAQAGYTTEDVLACVNDADVQACLAEADIILVSGGMNDIMTPYINLANSYIEEFGLSDFSELFTTSREDIGLTDSELLVRSAQLNNKASENKAAAIANINSIGEKLSAYDAQVVYVNVFHPMNTLEQYDSLSVNRKNAYDIGVINPIMGSLQSNSTGNLNASYAGIAETYGATLVDSYALFDKLAYRYSYPMELKPYLNEEGQNLLAKQTASDMGIFMEGDVNGNGILDTGDAAEILVHIADLGAGGNGTMNTLQCAAADVIADEQLDTGDASELLIRIAKMGAGAE